MKKHLALISSFVLVITVLFASVMTMSAATVVVNGLNAIENYDLYSTDPADSFVEENGIISGRTAGRLKAIYKNLILDDFSCKLETELDENGNIAAGILFRVSSADVGNGQDEMIGYAVQLRHNTASTPNRFDIVVYKFGRVDGNYKYMGEVHRKVNEGAEFIFAGISSKPGTKLILDMVVAGDTATMSVSLKDDPTKTTGDAVADLKKVTKASGIEYDQYYEQGSIGIYAGAFNPTTPVTTKILNLEVSYDDGVTTATTAPAATTTTGENTTTTTTTPPVAGDGKDYPTSGTIGALDAIASYDLFAEGTGVIFEENGVFRSNSLGNKKAILKNSDFADFKAEFTTKIDENGNLKVGIPFRVIYADNGKDGLKGYMCVVQRIASKPGRIDLIFYKYGELNGVVSYLGELGRSVNEGDESILAGLDNNGAGQELVLNLTVEGKQAKASFYLKDQPSKVSKTLECWLNMKTSKETTLLGKYYERGAIGLYFGNERGTVIDTMIYNFKVQALGVPGEGTTTTQDKVTDPTNQDDTNSPKTGYAFPLMILGIIMVSFVSLFATSKKDRQIN